MKNHKDILEILIAGASGFSLMLTNIELIIKVLIGFATLGYIGWKWYWDIMDRKNKK